ncbi:DUF4232 domain-containing protein [Agrococcus carbonis]|nr:DUF4232 domain-containing protein [Agrococcus carbonis]
MANAGRSPGDPIPHPPARRAGLLAIGAAASLAVTGCIAPPPEPTPSPVAVEPAPDADPTAAPEPHESELPPGFDSPPDSVAEPDASLTADELAALLRVPATGAVRPETCEPEDVEVVLSGYDVAAGSRFSTLRVTNAGGDPCALGGYPGIGARGEWGSTFLILAEQSPMDSGEPMPLVLEPGGSASAPIQWTGALAGAHDEHISMLVVQLAQDQAPVRVEPEIRAETMVGGDSGPPHDARMDVGMLTTVRVGAFVAD